MATVTITTDAGQDARLAPAYGAKLGLRNASGQPRNATTAEVKAYLVSVLRADVQGYEDGLYVAAKPQPTAFDPT